MDRNALSHLVTHLPLPADSQPPAPDLPPRDPFVAAGFAVARLAWQNPVLRHTRIPFTWPDRNAPRLRAFAGRYDFLKHVDAASSELERLLLLRQWVRRRISPGFSGTDPLDPFKILDLAAAGARFICTQYSIVLHACAVAAGWVARLVHVDSDHGPDEPSTSHGVVEVWVNELRKWVVLDAMYDVHYEKKGVILNVHEMAQEWIRNAGRNVEVRIGMPRRKVRHSGKGVLHRRHESSAYFWAKHLWTWDPFTSFGTSPVDCQLCLIGPEHDGKMWYQGKPPQTYPLHAIKRGALQFTRRHADIYPDMNTVRLALGVASGKPAVSVRVETCTPGFDALLIQLDGGDWCPADLRFDWYPHPGVNSLSVRTRNQFAMLGAHSNVTAVLKRGRKTP